jgi:hypothetical protein
MDRIAIIHEARTWLGTPFLPEGMIRGPDGGVDCACFPLAVLQACGLLDRRVDPRPYPRGWFRGALEYRRWLRRLGFVRIDPPYPPGALALFGGHCGIVEDFPIVLHAHDDPLDGGVVRESIYGPVLGTRRFVGCWDLAR